MGVVLPKQAAQRFPAVGDWPRGAPAEFAMNEAKLAQARDYALKGGGSGIVIHREKLVYSWGDTKALYDLKSTTKSFGATMLGLAVMDGKVKLRDPVVKYCPDVFVQPEGKASSWTKDITFWHLATQTAGFDKPGGYQPLLFEPGKKWAYSDSGPNYLADCLTQIYGRDLQDVMFERVFTPLGIKRDDLKWRDNQYRPKLLNGIPRREFGSGIHANVDAMARIGLMYNRAGRINSRQVLPLDFVAALRQPMNGVTGLPILKEEDYPSASNHYGVLWWNNGDGGVPGVPRDAFWTWGLYDSHIIVIPSLDLIVARAGKSPDTETNRSRIQSFLRPLAESVDAASAQIKAPYPPSRMIESIEWAPVETIRRDGSDCDNFPSTWGDDDELYTAHGDCRGFEPLRPQKLGLGFARIAGEPLSAKGINIETDADNTGEGAQGKKASGLLMLNGVLYMWARNAGNSQLAWSTDHAKTWTWSEWKFTTSFGHPAFLNFGRNYSGARDGYVYIYSPDEDTAYESSKPSGDGARTQGKNPGPGSVRVLQRSGRQGCTAMDERYCTARSSI